MNAIFLKRSLPWLICLQLTACSKIPLNPVTSPPPPVANTAAAAERIRSLHPQAAGADSGYTVLSVQNYQDGERSISLVTYSDQEGNVLTVAYVTRPDGKGGFLTEVITCESSSCNCAIEIYEKPDGQPDLRCSCTPCTMTVR